MTSGTMLVVAMADPLAAVLVEDSRRDQTTMAGTDTIRMTIMVCNL
jgi:hypothetical protein